MKIKLSILFLLISVILIYQHSYLDYSRRDQIEFMIERHYFKNDFAWLLHGINYDRERILAPGDYFMYRPGYHLFLTIEDLLRDHQALTGITSIALHLLVSCLLYFTFRSFFISTPAFPFIALFITQYAGIDMITWRYASPYMLCVVFMLIGFLLFSRLRVNLILTTSVLLAATLFNEVATTSMILLSIILFAVMKYRGSQKNEPTISIRKLTISMIVGISLYFLLDILNWSFTKPPAILGPADHFSPNLLFVKDALQNFLHYLGAGTRAVFDPFSIELQWKKSAYNMANFNWDIRSGDLQGYFAWAAFSAALLITAIAISLKRLLSFKETFAEIITLWACCGLLSFTSIFAIARLTCRDLRYAASDTCYYWFFYFFYIIIVKFLVDEIFRKVPNKFKWKKSLHFILCGLIIMVAIAQGWKAKRAIEENYDLLYAEQVKQAIDTADLYFQLNPNTCLDASEKIFEVPPRKQQLFTIPFYLNKYNCGWVPGKSIVHLYRTKAGIITIQPGPYPNKSEYKQSK